MKRIFAVFLAVLVFALPLTACTGGETNPEGSKSPSSQSGSSVPEDDKSSSESDRSVPESDDSSSRDEEKPITFREWDKKVPFTLVAGASTEVDATAKCTLGTDEEKIRKEVSLYLDPDEAEAPFKGSRCAGSGRISQSWWRRISSTIFRSS